MTERQKMLSGIVGYMVTPFDGNTGEIVFSEFGRLIEHLIASKVDAIAVLGCVGECAYLSDSEWESVVTQSMAMVNGRLPLIVGISELTTTKAIQKACFAEKTGVDIIMLSPLQQYELTEQEIYHYFERVSEAISTPIMLYNNPDICGIDMSVDLIFSIVTHIECVSMIKESSSDINKLDQLYAACQASANLFVGCNNLALDALLLGVSGWCTASPNLLGTAPHDISELIRKKEIEKAKDCFMKYKPLLRFMVEKGLARTVKAGLILQGVDVGMPRKPVETLSNDEIELLSALLR